MLTMDFKKAIIRYESSLTNVDQAQQYRGPGTFWFRSRIFTLTPEYHKQPVRCLFSFQPLPLPHRPLPRFRGRQAGQIEVGPAQAGHELRGHGGQRGNRVLQEAHHARQTREELQRHAHRPVRHPADPDHEPGRAGADPHPQLLGPTGTLSSDRVRLYESGVKYSGATYCAKYSNYGVKIASAM